MLQLFRLSGGNLSFQDISRTLNLTNPSTASQHLSTFYVVCFFFELEPVDDGDTGFEFIVLFFRTLFVGSLTVGSTVVGEVANSTDFVEVVPCPRSDTGPVLFRHRDGD